MVKDKTYCIGEEKFIKIQEYNGCLSCGKFKCKSRTYMQKFTGKTIMMIALKNMRNL